MALTDIQKQLLHDAVRNDIGVVLVRALCAFGETDESTEVIGIAALGVIVGCFCASVSKDAEDVGTIYRDPLFKPFCRALMQYLPKLARELILKDKSIEAILFELEAEMPGIPAL